MTASAPCRRRRTRSRWWAVPVLLATLVFAGCVPPSRVYHSKDTIAPPLQSSVVVLPPDVVVSVMNAGGNLEPRADWSEAVARNLEETLVAYMYDYGVEVIPYGGELKDQDVALFRQLNVLLDAIEMGQVRDGIGGDRDYAIGRAEREGLSNLGADYAILIVLRANRASTGRQVFAVISAVARVPVETSSLRFRSALIDLRDGHITWANFDDTALADIGDLLKASPEKWAKALEHLLREFPL